MISMRNFVRLCGAALPLLWLGVSHGTDFTLVVPLNVSNLPPEIDRVRVCCQVADASAGGRLIGSGSTCQSAAVVGRAFRGDITVLYDAAPGVNPATARAYNCKAGFEGMVRGVRTTFDSNAAGGRDISLSSGNLVVSGPIAP
jgi:hypothetical protein